MVQFTCTILRTQGTEPFKEEWALSFQVGVWQLKLRVFCEAGGFAERVLGTRLDYPFVIVCHLLNISGIHLFCLSISLGQAATDSVLDC